MHRVEHIFKEAAEVALRGLYRRKSGRPPRDFAPWLDEAKARGYAVVERFWSSARCVDAIGQIDRELASDTTCHRWIDAEASDNRLYFAERAGGELELFFRTPVIESIRRDYSGVARAETILLAARLDYVVGNKGSGGGWHRDSPHRSQFKALLYLSDVEPENGPFEYLEGTHLAWQSVRLLLDGKCQPNQSRFSDEEVARLHAAGVVRRTFVAPAGTLLLVDTKGIHRGRPIVRGRRYALTQYCFDGARPRDFLP